jgi:hypothetical protein
MSVTLHHALFVSGFPARFAEVVVSDNTECHCRYRSVKGAPARFPGPQ